MTPWELIEERIERGVACGYRRAYKHNDTPSEATLKHEICEAVESKMHDVLDVVVLQMAMEKLVEMWRCGGVRDE
jgi:hypothetical protein